MPDILLPCRIRERPARRRLALLALLTREHGSTRDRVIAYLSPESATESARHSLHQLIDHLRRRTADDVFIGTDPLRLNPAVISSDRADFEPAVERGDLAAVVAVWSCLTSLCGGGT